jgi:hypothetical protein
VGSPLEAADALLVIARTAKREADRLAAWRELLDRGWGRAASFAAVEGADPLELDAVAAEITQLADELRARRAS